MLKISYAGCLGLSLACRRNSLLECVSQPEITKNLRKFLILGVQSRSRSSMLIKLKSPWPVLVMISNTYVLIYNHFHTRRTNSGKITFLRGGGTPLWRPRSRGTPSPRGTKFRCDKLEFLRQRTVKMSWFLLAPFWYNTAVWRTDGQTPRPWLRRAKHSAIERKNATFLYSLNFD